MKRQENRTMETKQYATSLKWILITFNIFLHLPQCTGESNSSVWHEIMKVLKGNSYNRYFRPEKESGNITVVFVNVYVEAVGMMDSSKEMPLFLVVTETWTDKQLVPNEGSQGNLLFEERLVPLFWTPKLLLGNAGTQQDVKVYSKKIVLKPNGKLTLSYRVIFPVSCQKHINLFPLDGQICSIKIKSFYYPVEEVQVKWESNTDWQKSLDKLEIFNFDLAKIKLTEENTTQFGRTFFFLLFFDFKIAELPMSEHANTSYKEDSFSNRMVTERDVDEYKITAAAADNKNVGKRIFRQTVVN
ncbi:glutamate-gated chloride channel-like [Octopus vulgaris]|uniref:Glutamate-gated chloride channel-like n=1 Tax=Octopus vulgaris TaxID=6645 RepID=A0AA36B382_OCTVU|nr:glutamate-gated chloride channel-like [Octopus vulgaris]